jgi:hypothetical protein
MMMMMMMMRMGCFLFFSFLLHAGMLGCGAWGLVCNPKNDPSPPFNPIVGMYLGT